MPKPCRIETIKTVLAHCNVAFGQRLLGVAPREHLEFNDFVATAKALVDEDPLQAAIHLAGWVALDVAEDSELDTNGDAARTDRVADAATGCCAHGLERGVVHRFPGRATVSAEVDPVAADREQPPTV